MLHTSRCLLVIQDDVGSAGLQGEQGAQEGAYKGSNKGVRRGSAGGQGETNKTKLNLPEKMGPEKNQCEIKEVIRKGSGACLWIDDHR